MMYCVRKVLRNYWYEGLFDEKVCRRSSFVKQIPFVKLHILSLKDTIVGRCEYLQSVSLVKESLGVNCVCLFLCPFWELLW